MPQKDAEPQYTKSTEQLYKESLRADPETVEAGSEGRVMQVEGNDTSAYIGADPVYQNYANEGEKPYAPEAGTADAAIVDEFVASQQHTVSTVEGEATAEAAPATPESTENKPTLSTPASRPTDKAAAKKA